jgi:hypothetical protein
MTDTAATLATAPEPTGPGLFSRLVGILFSPQATYAAVAARPRALGALAVITLLMIACQFGFLSTELGKDLALEQQVRGMESFGMTVTDEVYAQIEQRMENARYYNAVSLLIFIPLVNVIVAGLLLVVFSMLLGGAATFKHVNAVAAHAGVVLVLQQLFSLPLTLASGQLAGANLGIFVPMLEETSFPVLFLGSIDLFVIWWAISLAIGIGVLYRRKTRPIAIAFISLYVIIALIIALVRS